MQFNCSLTFGSCLKFAQGSSNAIQKKLSYKDCGSMPLHCLAPESLFDPCPWPYLRLAPLCPRWREPQPLSTGSLLHQGPCGWTACRDLKKEQLCLGWFLMLPVFATLKSTHRRPHLLWVRDSVRNSAHLPRDSWPAKTQPFKHNAAKHFYTQVLCYGTVCRWRLMYSI